MNQNTRHFLKQLWQSVVFWTLVMLCYVVFRYYGMDEEIGVTIKKGYEGGRWLSEPLAVMPIMGCVLGILYGIVDFLIEKYFSKKNSLGFGLLMKTM